MGLILVSFFCYSFVMPKKKRKKKSSPVLLAFLFFLVLIAFILGYKFKGLIVVATVNKKPISTWQFGRYLWRQYGQRAFDELILETLVGQEAQNNQVDVSLVEIQEEIKRIKEEIGGQEAFEEVLESQGLTEKEFEEKIKLQLVIEKLLEKKISITEREIEVFIKQYEAQLEATDEAGQKKEAQEILKSQKMAESYQSFFPELKEKAKIVEFLKF